MRSVEMKNTFDSFEKSHVESVERLLQVTPTMFSTQGKGTTGMMLLLSRSAENITSITTLWNGVLLNWLGTWT
jgi:hypothetical protein